MRFVFTRALGTTQEAREFGYFATAEAAGRYARQGGFTNYREDGSVTATEFDVVDGQKDLTGKIEAIVSAPDVPGLAFEDAFITTPWANLRTPDVITGYSWANAKPQSDPDVDWEALALSEGNTSDISEAYVAKNVILYNVTRTLEITVPVYAADKEAAIAAIKDESSVNLILNSGANTKVFATTARVKAGA